MPTFDIVSKVPWHEVDNAINQAQKEIATRFDFRGTGADIENKKETIVLVANAEDRVKAVLDVLKEKLVKRKVSLKHLDVGKIEATGKVASTSLMGKSGSKISITVKEGIDSDHAKQIVKWIKDEKLKVQASIVEQQVRVTGKKKDDLQSCIAAIREKEFDIELQFVNFRD
ncbi:MAG: YajQ family cyclic di-GMP-binding protein [Polyangiaceae bacterium]|nr:YajQ family cyclic di-GMP-binding protein [Polyangiaceae bacterium]